MLPHRALTAAAHPPLLLTPFLRLLLGAGRLQVVSLGSHLMDPSPASPPLLLMEVMPQGGWG